MTEVYIGIGSNLERERNIRRALRCLRDHYPRVNLSSVYESDAVGFEGPPFLNLIAHCDTADSIAQTLQVLHRIEMLCGREQNSALGSRSVDLDLLLFGQCVVDDGHQCIPHPDILLYGFVLQPLAELAGGLTHPQDGRTIAALWASFQDSAQPLAKPYPMGDL